MATEANYPSHLELKLVQILHRHGHRTALRQRLPGLIPPIWTRCFESNVLMHNFLTKSLEGNSNEDTHSINHPSYEKKGKQANINFVVPTFGNVFRLVYEKNNNDLAKAASGTCYLGQLTDDGRRAMRGFGGNLRDLYVNQLGFLPSTFHPSSVYLRSTEYARTIESVQCLFSGLYPQATLPITLNIRKEQDETMFPSGRCPRLKQLEMEFRESFLRDYSDRISSIKKKLNGLFQVPDEFGNYPSIHGLFDSVYCAKEHKISENIVTNEDMKELEKLSAAEWYTVFKKSKEAVRLGIGRLVNEIAINIQSKIKGLSKDLKLIVFSGHDTSIAPLLAAFDVLGDEWPPFASNIILELFEEKQSPNKHHVRLIFNGNYMKMPACKSTIDGRPELCPINEFLEMCEKLTPKNYTLECTTRQ